MYELKLCEGVDVFDPIFEKILQYKKFDLIPYYFKINQVICFEYGERTLFYILNDEALAYLEENNIDYYFNFKILEYDRKHKILDKLNLSIFLPDEETAFYFKLKFC